MPESKISTDILRLYFELFNEIGIIEQLSRTIVEARLPHGFLISHFSVLNHLIRVEDGRTPLDIARAFEVPKTTMTHTLSGLEKHGLIEMRPNPDDGRSKRVWITEKGRDFRQNAIESITPEFLELSAVFPHEQISELVPRLTKIREYLDKRRENK